MILIGIQLKMILILSIALTMTALHNQTVHRIADKSCSR